MNLDLPVQQLALTLSDKDFLQQIFHRTFRDGVNGETRQVDGFTFVFDDANFCVTEINSDSEIYPLLLLKQFDSSSISYQDFCVGLNDFCAKDSFAQLKNLLTEIGSKIDVIDSSTNQISVNSKRIYSVKTTVDEMYETIGDVQKTIGTINSNFSTQLQEANAITENLGVKIEETTKSLSNVVTALQDELTKKLNDDLGSVIVQSLIKTPIETSKIQSDYLPLQCTLEDLGLTNNNIVSTETNETPSAGLAMIALQRQSSIYTTKPGRFKLWFRRQDVTSDWKFDHLNLSASDSKLTDVNGTYKINVSESTRLSFVTGTTSTLHVSAGVGFSDTGTSKAILGLADAYGNVIESVLFSTVKGANVTDVERVVCSYGDHADVQLRTKSFEWEISNIPAGQYYLFFDKNASEKELAQFDQHAQSAGGSINLYSLSTVLYETYGNSFASLGTVASEILATNSGLSNEIINKIQTDVADDVSYLVTQISGLLTTFERLNDSIKTCAEDAAKSYTESLMTTSQIYDINLSANKIINSARDLADQYGDFKTMLLELCSTQKSYFETQKSSKTDSYATLASIGRDASLALLSFKEILKSDKKQGF